MLHQPPPWKPETPPTWWQKLDGLAKLQVVGFLAAAAIVVVSCYVSNR